MNQSRTPLILFNTLYQDELFCALEEYTRTLTEQSLYQTASLAIKNGYECALYSYLTKLIVTSDNALARTLAAQKQPSSYVKQAFYDDLNVIFRLVNSCNTHGMFALGKPDFPLDNNFHVENSYKNLASYYAQNGFGDFIEHAAFRWEEHGLVPVATLSTVRLTDLKDYVDEKKVISDNISSFLKGLPYENMLLYGDRGTGKSSTVHAMLNEYRANGLRLIELDRDHLVAIPAVRSYLRGNPLKFIVFIDDLSFGEYDERASFLKAALEGSISSHSDNVLIIATSNRRHIVKETFSDRENAVHAKDSIEEQLSLSDRFGITVLFSTTDKAQYLSIVKQLATDCGLPLADEELFALAERWALTKGGRSPRRAKQFVNLAYASCQSHTPIPF
jgi:hypothetical protein